MLVTGGSGLGRGAGQGWAGLVGVGLGCPAGKRWAAQLVARCVLATLAANCLLPSLVGNPTSGSWNYLL